MRRMYKNFVFDIVIAAISLAVGVVMLPPFGIAEYALNILLATTLVIYLLSFLFDKLRHTKGTVFIFTLIEFLAISLIAIGLVIRQFMPLNIDNVWRALGAAIWLRGVVMTLEMYVAAMASKKPRRNIPRLVLAIAFISLGAFLFARPITSDVALEWVICISFLLCALIFAGLAFLFAPVKKSK